MLHIPSALRPEMLDLSAHPIKIAVSSEVREAITRCHRYLLRCLEGQRPVYGANTGFGPQVNFPGRKSAVDQCDNVLQHLTVGQGEDLSPEVARAAMLVRTWSLCSGSSGVSAELIDALVALLATDFAPAIPRLGSVGASGDLVPLAHAAQGLRGHGFAYWKGQRMGASEALSRAGLRPFDLDGRDALALVNGTSVSSAIAGLALNRIKRGHALAHTMTACLVDLLGCGHEFLAPALLRAYGHSAAEESADRLRQLLSNSTPSNKRALQEPYSIRCTPQLLGAVGGALSYVEQTVIDDLNGVSDNPLFFPEEDLVAHGGNFFGQPCAFASDLAAIVTVQMGNLVERQIDLLVDPNRNGGLPPMLSVDPGRQHGVQGVQVLATSTIAAMRRLSLPASVQSIPTNLHNQDVVPFSTQAALNAFELAKMYDILIGCLAISLRQAAHVSSRAPTGSETEKVFATLSSAIAPIDPDRPLYDEIPKAVAALNEYMEAAE